MDSEATQAVVGALLAGGVIGGLVRVVQAWLRAFERAANAKWVEHSDGDNDDEDKVRRAVDSWKAEGSRVPRVVLEHQVRKSKATRPPRRPDESPPD